MFPGMPPGMTIDPATGRPMSPQEQAMNAQKDIVGMQSGAVPRYGTGGVTPPPATTTPAEMPALDRDWSQSYMANPTGYNSETGQNYGMNPTQFANDETAQYLAQQLGGTVKDAPFDAAGPFSLNQNYNQIDIGGGRPQFNAGLVADKMQREQGHYQNAMRDWQLNKDAGSTAPPPTAPTPQSVMQKEIDYYDPATAAKRRAEYSAANVRNTISDAEVKARNNQPMYLSDGSQYSVAGGRQYPQQQQRPRGASPLPPASAQARLNASPNSAVQQGAPGQQPPAAGGSVPGQFRDRLMRRDGQQGGGGLQRYGAQRQPPASTPQSQSAASSMARYSDRQSPMSSRSNY